MKKFKNAKPAAAKPELIKPKILEPDTVKSRSVRIATIAPVTARPGTVSFELVKPGAKQVYVAGSFNNWKPETSPLIPKDDGRWVGDMAIKPGRYEYLFVVDGQWVPDPNAKETVQNPFGGLNSILGVSE
jgi:1,4-alpha-glucan branching enzyme